MTKEQFYLHTLADHWQESGFPFAADLLRHHANEGVHGFRDVPTPSTMITKRMPKAGGLAIAGGVDLGHGDGTSKLTFYHVDPGGFGGGNFGRRLGSVSMPTRDAAAALHRLHAEGHPEAMADFQFLTRGQPQRFVDEAIANPPTLNTARPHAEEVESPPTPEDFYSYSRARLARAKARHDGRKAARKLARRIGVRRYSHEAFAAAIRRRPNDPVARGAYADYLEENDAHADPATLDALRGPDPVWMGIATDREGRRLVIARPNPKRTMANVRAANRAAGHTWFSPGSMRFFDSRMERRVHTGPGGTYFVSSEQFSPAARRYWSVRHLHPSGDVRTHGPFQGYVSPEDAHAAAAEAAAQTPPGLTRMGRPYRAPAGGTVVRGVYYVGGSLLPDLTGPFATGQTPSRPAPPPKSRKINWAAALRRWTGRQRNR